jgi:hypothetical protein
VHQKLPEAERLERCAHGAGIAGDEQLQPRRVEVPLGNASHVGGGDGADARAVGVEIVVGEAVQRQVRQRARDRRRRLVADREDADEIARCERQLFARDVLGADALDLLQIFSVLISVFSL